MAGAVTWEMLRDLAGFRAGKGCAISLYLNLDPSVAPTAAEIATRTSSLLAEGERVRAATKDELSHDQRAALKADLERIARWFDEEFDRDGCRGAAVFADELDGLWAAFGVPDPVADALTVAPELHLAPLVPLVGSGEGALVAFVGRERGQVFRLHGSRLVELADATEDVPSQHDQGGWSQARYERHIENIVGQHLRRVAETLEGCVRKLPAASIVLVGTEHIRPELEGVLSNEVRDAVVGWAQAEAHASPAELLEAAGPVLERRRAEREEELLARWREEAGRAARASSGWQETLEAASDGRVELLLVQEGAGRAGYRCPECGRAQASGGSCPLDGTQLEEQEDGLDLAVHQTLAHGGTVSVIREGHDLEPVEGIGALLRY